MAPFADSHPLRFHSEFFRDRAPLSALCDPKEIAVLAELLTPYRDRPGVSAWITRRLEEHFNCDAVNHTFSYPTLEDVYIRRQAFTRYPTCFTDASYFRRPMPRVMAQPKALSELWRIFPCKLAEPALLHSSVWSKYPFETSKQPSIPLWGVMMREDGLTQEGIKVLPPEACDTGPDFEIAQKVLKWIKLGKDASLLSFKARTTFIREGRENLSSTEYARMAASLPPVSYECLSLAAFRNAALILPVEHIILNARRRALGLLNEVSNDDSTESKWHCFLMQPQYLHQLSPNLFNQHEWLLIIEKILAVQAALTRD